MDENAVRVTSKRVVENATHVSINEDAIGTLADSLSDTVFETPTWTAPVFITTDNYDKDEVIDFLVIGNAINYCFRDLQTGDKYAVEYNDETWEGRFGMWAALKRALDNNHAILDGYTLSNLQPTTIETIFTPKDGHPPLPLMQKRIDYLHEVGDYLALHNTFASLFDNSRPLFGRNGIVKSLTRLMAFKDKWDHLGKTVVFNKRAQLAAATIHGRFDNITYNDLDKLTVFADYEIPAYLHAQDVLEYSPELSYYIETNTPLKPGTPEEVEIRAATVIAGDKLQSALQQRTNSHVTISQLNYTLWQQHRDANTNPHYCETTAY